MKHSTMIGSYEKCRLKDVDLESKFQSLRIIWVRKMLEKANSHPWMAIANTVLQDLRGVNIFHTNLSTAQEKRLWGNHLFRSEDKTIPNKQLESKVFLWL